VTGTGTGARSRRRVLYSTFMATPLASIVLPTYNRAYSLPKTIDSVLAQSYRELEVVIVDDGSTDGTGDLIESRYGTDSRVRYHYRNNGGVSAARNTAMRLVRGEVLVFCDSDDLWTVDKLRLQMEAFERFPEVNLVWTDVSAMDPAGAILHERYTRLCYPAWKTRPLEEMFARSEDLGATRVYVGNVFATMVGGTLVNMPSVAIRASLPATIGNFDETMRTGEDYDFTLRACAVGPVAFIDVPTVLYRVGAPDQLTHASLHADQARNWFRAVARFREAGRLPAMMSPQRMKAILAGKYQWLGMSELLCDNRRAARAALWQSIRHGSRSARLWLTLLSTLLPAGLARSLRAVLRSLKSHGFRQGAVERRN
jgi:GT2 family glycosyltransferase